MRGSPFSPPFESRYCLIGVSTRITFPFTSGLLSESMVLMFGRLSSDIPNRLDLSVFQSVFFGVFKYVDDRLDSMMIGFGVAVRVMSSVVVVTSASDS